MDKPEKCKCRGFLEKKLINDGDFRLHLFFGGSKRGLALRHLAKVHFGGNEYTRVLRFRFCVAKHKQNISFPGWEIEGLEIGYILLFEIFKASDAIRLRNGKLPCTVSFLS